MGKMLTHRIDTLTILNAPVSVKSASSYQRQHLIQVARKTIDAAARSLWIGTMSNRAAAIANNNLLVGRCYVASMIGAPVLTSTAEAAFPSFIVRLHSHLIAPFLVVFSTEPYEFLYTIY